MEINKIDKKLDRILFKEDYEEDYQLYISALLKTIKEIPMTEEQNNEIHLYIDNAEEVFRIANDKLISEKEKLVRKIAEELEDNFQNNYQSFESDVENTNLREMCAWILKEFI